MRHRMLKACGSWSSSAVLETRMLLAADISGWIHATTLH